MASSIKPTRAIERTPNGTAPSSAPSLHERSAKESDNKYIIVAKIVATVVTNIIAKPTRVSQK
jgi:hypothetical protein